METRKLAVIMFTDMVGYSKKVSEDEQGALQLLEEHNQILEPQIRAYRGTVIKTIGDAFMADFDSVFNAVNCAADIQTALAARNETAEGEKIDVRIGIHVGDVVYRENDVFGDGVNIASRIEAIADGGQVFISHDILSIVYDKLDHKYKDVGSRSLKNINHPVHIYEVLWDPARADEATDVQPMHRRAPSRAGQSKAVIGGVVGALIAAVLVFFLLQPSEETGKPRLAIVAFGDETGDARMGQVQIGKIIQDAVLQKFYEFPHVQLVSPIRVYKAKKDLNVSDEALVQDPGLAETVARETDGRLMVAGSLSKLGDTFILSAKLTDLAQDGKMLSSFRLERQSEEEILGSLVDSLCTRFQRRIMATFEIDEARPYQNLAVGELTTNSLEAYSHFVKGNEIYKSGRIRKGVEELALATEIDSNCALAYSLTACAYSLTKQDSMSDVFFKKARKFRERFTGISKESLIFRGNDAWYDVYASEGAEKQRNLENCQKSYRLITELYPDDRDGYYYYGLYFYYLQDDVDAAIQQFDRVIELTPDWFPVYRDKAYAITKGQGNDEAIKFLQGYIKGYPEGEGADFARQTIAQLRGVSSG